MKGRAVIGALAALWAVGAAAQPASLDWQEVVTRVVRDQPSLEAARLQAERARLELQKLEASLGWVFQGSATASHDVSFIGTPSDSVQGRAGVQRRQANGVTWGMGGSYTYQNDSFVFSPLLPNPYHYFTWDVNARIPLGQGQGNPDYHLGRQQAGAAEEMARLARDEQRDALAAQAIDLYFAAAFTRERILNAKAGIEFSERIRAYILRNMELGLFEDKDRLQIEAQLAGQRAQHRALETAWVEQRTALNQLMNRPWDTPFLPRIDLNDAPLPDLERLVARALAYDPQLARLRARLTQVDATIARARDRRRDKLDLVLKAGVRGKGGPAQVGTVASNDVAAALSLEYRHALDKSAFDAELAQARIDAQVVQEQMRARERALRYRIANLVEQIRAHRAALAGFRAQMEKESARLTEAEARFRDGRATTVELIQFENELKRTELAVLQQQIETARKRAQLRLLTGALWSTGEENP